MPKAPMFYGEVNGDQLLLDINDWSQVLGVSIEDAAEHFKDGTPIVGNEMISAEAVAATKNPDNGEIIVTMKAVAPKFLDGELRAHRWFSQNSSSSRAIPVNRTLEKGLYIPDDIRLAEKGMQGYTSMDDADELLAYRKRFMYLGNLSAHLIDTLADRVHKQHLNRYVEPWTLQTKIFTGGLDAYEHFFSLRCADDSDPAINNLAYKMQDVFDEAVTTAIVRPPDKQDWHLPFITQEERDTYSVTKLMHASAARCARVSYNNFDGKSPDIEKDIKLARMLEASHHASPFEHVAVTSSRSNKNGNLPKGFAQLRKIMNI